MSKLSLTEELDFHYLLTLMLPMHQEDNFAWLPELFSIIGHERLILLCNYAGGETIKLPTLEELSDSIEALQYFYDIEIKHTKTTNDVPEKLVSLVAKIHEVYNNA